MPRIGFADHLFLRMHHGIGYPVYNQFLWRFDEQIDRSALESLHRQLSRGLLNRHVRSSILPIARDRWVEAEQSHPLDWCPDEVSLERIREWSSETISDDIDPERGLGWLLSASPVAGGGTIVSLVCSHMVADGAAMIAAVRAANGAVSGEPLGSYPSVVAALTSDIGDAAGQLAPVLRWGARAVRAAVPGLRPAPPELRPAAPDSPTRTEVPANEKPWSPPFVIAECDAAGWHAAAQRWGGTSNSLVVGLLTALTADAGRAAPGETITWSLPVSGRTRDTHGDIDNRSNSTKIAKAAVPVPADGDADLRPVRAAMKAAFVEFSARDGAHPPDAIPLELIHMLPDALVKRIPQPKDGAEGLCSNLGVLPDDFAVLGGVRARSIVAHATFLGADATYARTVGGGLTAWAGETEHSVTLCIHGMDPDRYTDDGELEKLVAGAFGRWDLDVRFW